LEKKILILGKNGQLAKTLINKLINKKISYKCISSKQLNFLKPESIPKILNQYEYDIIINCFAYTNVDRAEIEKKECLKINSTSIKYLAKYCKQNNKFLIHFSTDYIFNSNTKNPIREDFKQSPINYYGYSKSLGEKNIVKIDCNYLILRISWTYSIYGKNFLKTIVQNLVNNKELHIISDQFGCPTNLEYLSLIIIKFLKKINIKSKNKLIFNFSHKGKTSWYHYAKEIEKNLSFKNKSLIFKTNSGKYFTKAKRPNYSKLSNTKLKNFLMLKDNKSWKVHLKNFIIENKSKLISKEGN